MLPTRSATVLTWSSFPASQWVPFLLTFGLVLAEYAHHTQANRAGIVRLSDLHRHPKVMVQLAATLDELSGGRFRLGMRLWPAAGEGEGRHPWGAPLPDALDPIPIKRSVESFPVGCLLASGVQICN